MSENRKTMSYDEFERMPLFHEKGLLPRGKYLFTSVKMDAVPKSKTDYFYHCIEAGVIEVMDLEIDGSGKMNAHIELFTPDFRDIKAEGL